jgi:hypothetical protein
MTRIGKKMSLLSILNRLEATSSRLEKERILNENKNNQILKTAFRLALDPSINFYIKAVPDPRSGGPMTDLESTFEMLEVGLAGRLVRGGAARDRVALALGALEGADREVVRRVIGRNLRCGVSESTVQKIWPDLQLSWPCMLVSTGTITFPCLAQTKCDGMRFSAVMENGQVTYHSRVGKELDLFGVLDEDVLHITAGQDFVLDGELLMTGPDGKPMDRKTGNGLLTKFQKGTGTLELAQQIRAVVWDIIPLSDFRRGSCSTPYQKRHLMLYSLRIGRIQVAPVWVVNTREEAQTLFEAQVAKGQEGLVLKDPKGPWDDKRVKHQVKMKAELEADLEVTGIIPGTGKYEGKIGSLQVSSTWGKVTAAVGTGLSDEDRSKDPGEYMGKIVAIKYNALINDKKTGSTSLFLPVFIEVREDKVTPDDL